MIRLLNFILLNLIFTNLFSQNLILNGSFEERNVCKEFKATCSPLAWKTLNLSADNFILNPGKSGEGSGILAEKRDAFDFRTYIKTRLLCTLQKDSLYDVSLFVKSPTKGVPSLSFLFTDQEVIDSSMQRLAITPSITFTDTCFEQPFRNQNWNFCHILYKAVGDETHLLIGNFKADAESNIAALRSLKSGEIVYSLDDVSIKPHSDTPFPCEDMDKNKAEIVSDIERHTAHLTLLRRLKLKEAQLLGTTFNPNKASQKTVTPCAGDDWQVEYHVDSFPIFDHSFAQDASKTQNLLLEKWNSIKDSCIGVSIIAFTNADDSPMGKKHAFQKAHETAAKISALLRIEKTMICIQEKAIKSVSNSSIYGGSENSESDVKNRSVVLFLVRE
jgi:hypothetical protein